MLEDECMKLEGEGKEPERLASALKAGLGALPEAFDQTEEGGNEGFATAEALGSGGLGRMAFGAIGCHRSYTIDCLHALP